MDLKFSVHKFDYTIKYYEESLYILCEHQTEFFKWSQLFTSEYFEEIQTGLMSFKFTTKFMYDLLSKYSQNKLEKNIEITFPEKIKDAAVSIPIIFTIHSVEKITKLITLDNVKMEDKERLEKIINMQQKQISYLSKQVEKLNDRFITIDLNNIEDEEIKFSHTNPYNSEINNDVNDANIQTLLDKYADSLPQADKNNCAINIQTILEIDLTGYEFKNPPILLFHKYGTPFLTEHILKISYSIYDVYLQKINGKWNLDPWNDRYVPVRNALKTLKNNSNNDKIVLFRND